MERSRFEKPLRKTEIVLKLCLAVLLLLVLQVLSVDAQQNAGRLSGQVVDELGALVVGASVSVMAEGGTEKTVSTDRNGQFEVGELAPGNYSVRISAAGFAEYTSEVEIAARGHQQLSVKLSVNAIKQEVTVAPGRTLSVDPENNASAIVLSDKELDALPDDPDELAAALQALAGPSAGPSGGQIYIDGFTGGRVPPKGSIRDVRINQNPFSAEYDRLGFGRLEITTKPGSVKFQGQAFFNFTDESLNSRNPFAAERAPFQERRYGGNLSGPVLSHKGSFFLDFERREIDDNALVNARILDAALNIVAFNQSIVTPQRRTTFSPRFDYQLNERNTLTARYTFTRFSFHNAGLEDNLSLPSRAYDSFSTEQTAQFSETAALNQRMVKEVRFQYLHRRQDQRGDNSIPTIIVREAFSGGGAQIGSSFNNEDRFELQNNTSLVVNQHTLKFGGRLRVVRLTNLSQQNFGGTFIFTSLEQYRQVLLGTPGFHPSQFSIVAGNPEARVTQTDVGLFVQDDWRLRRNFILSLGLRYETQSNIGSALNFAPRVAFAWSPAALNKGQRQTVIRGGFGIFYDRVGEELTLQADRFNGINQQQFLVRDPNFFNIIPPTATIANAQTAQTVRPLDVNLQAPYIMQTAISLERRLPLNSTLTVTFVNARALHQLRSRNINAPLPGTFNPGVPSSGVRPFGAVGNIFEVESSGIFNQNQFIAIFNSRPHPRLVLLANYALNKARSDTIDASIFPVDPYDLTSEYGRSGLDVRHRFFMAASYDGPLGIRFNPFIVAFSNRPFNITTGTDFNGDAVFAERPALATDLTRPSVVMTRFGAFDLNPLPGQQPIPRNFASGPSYFIANLRVSKTFELGNSPKPSAAVGPSPGGPRPGGAAAATAAGGPPARGNTRPPEKPYKLTFTVQIANLFNHVNAGRPIGNLSSPLFGQSVSISPHFGFGEGRLPANNRRIDLQINFSF